MAVSSLQSNAFSPRPIALMGSLNVPVYEQLESASHQGIDGAVVVFSSGYLDAGSADLTSGLVGFQIGAGHNDAAAGTSTLQYVPALPGLIVEITLEDETNEDHTVVQTNIGSSYALQVDNDGVWYLDENDTANDAMTVIGVTPDTVIGTTTRARVYAVPVGNVTIWAA